jgi:Tol biopolymer transport system component
MTRRALLLATLLSSPVLAQAPATPAATTLPLKVARTHTFTTTKGTWLSLDLSPDGQTLVFDMLGDLYSLPVAGGTATRLTSGLAFDAQPRFSPDGKRLVFVSDRSGGDNVWMMSLDGKDTVQVTKGNNADFVSPESRRTASTSSCHVQPACLGKRSSGCTTSMAGMGSPSEPPVHR